MIYIEPEKKRGQGWKSIGFRITLKMVLNGSVIIEKRWISRTGGGDT